jgi:predicted esterase of the alpha-beta hydrolase superfamily
MSIGVALAGGGLKGLAHIGALKALEELGIKIDFLSGTSSGSIFASFYAMGFSTDEIKERTIENYNILTQIKKGPIVKAGISYFTSGIAKIEGLVPGENIENLIKKVAKEKDIVNMNQIKIPYAIATVDTISTKECIFLSKKFDLKDDNIDYIYDAPIATATRASMSFPGIFTPCQYGKYNFIDGGTKDNLPVKILKDMGADKTIALSFRIDDYEPKEDILAILLRTVDIFSLKDVRKAQKEADLAIEIDARGASLLEIDDADKLMKTGYDTIMKYKKQILDLLT